MPKPWLPLENEPPRWYSRFHEHYLLTGPERSIDDAYRRYRARADSGGESAGRRRRPKTPGDWSNAAKIWDWANRAVAYDREQQAEERRKLAKDLYEARKKAAQKHQAIIGAGLNWVMKQLARLAQDDRPAPMTTVIPLASQLIRLNREELGAPIHVEVTHRGQARPEGDGPSYDDAAGRAAAEQHARFEAGPEVYAAVSRIMEQHETKVTEADDAPADPPSEPEVPHDEPGPGPAPG